MLPTRSGWSLPFPTFVCYGKDFLFSLRIMLYSFSGLENLLMLWVSFSLVLGILLVVLHFAESSQESKLLRLLSDRNSVSPGP